MRVRICILLTIVSAIGTLSEDRLPQYRQVRSRQPFPSLALKDLFADELDVEGPNFATNPQKRDVSHVLSGTANSPSGASSGSGSFASSGSFAGSSSSSTSKPGTVTPGGYAGSGTGAGHAGAATGGGAGYTSIGTSYTPNTGFQDYYSNPNQLSSSYPYYPPQNSVPHFRPGFDFQNFLQQYFSNLQAQQEAFQAQLQAQQQAAGYSWAGSGAYMTNPDGTIDPNARVYSYSHSMPGMAMASSAVDSNSVYDGSYSSSRGNRFFEMNNRLGYGFPYSQQFPSAYGNNPGAGFGGFGGNAGGFGGNAGGFGGTAGGFGVPVGGYSGSSSGSGPQVATASANLGTGGGQLSASISPAAPGIFSRFGESIPPPSGNSFGVFTSSSSGHAVGPDGKETSYKSATTGVNDNGKVSYHTVRDP